MRKGFALMGALAFASMLGMAANPQASIKGGFNAISSPKKKVNPLMPSATNRFKIRSHAINIQEKNRHTNRLRSRKQAKLRAKRKAKR